jgi:hypothetical protein
MSLLKEIIKEMAAGGAIGAGSVAANPSTDGNIRRRVDINASSVENDWRSKAKLQQQQKKEDLAKLMSNPEARERVLAARKRLEQKNSILYRMKKYMGLAEAFDMDDVVSRLKDMEGRNTEDTITYGVEDDAGNIMKVTVRRDAAAEFEERLSSELSNATQLNNELGKQKSTSMAELLFKLKNEFEIVDVEFPQIPANAIYNADKVKMSNDGDAVGGEVDLDNNIEPDQTGEMGMGDEMGGDASGLGMDAGGDEMGGEMGADGDLGDDESVSDFSEPEPSSGGVEGLLQSILAMLTADADAKKAQAEAESEKARALQAEYTAKAASASVEQQAELLAMEQSVESQKKKEKEARRISDLAKHRVKQTNGMAMESVETKSKHINFMLFEVETGDTTRSVMAAMQAIRMSSLPQQEKNLAMKELRIRLQRVALQAKTNRMQQGQNQQNNQQQNNQQQNNQQSNQQQNNQQQNNQQQINQQNNQQQVGRLGSMR